MILTASEICAGYGVEDVVSNVSFEVRSGDVLCLLGPNGVGKTTLFKALLGFLPTRSGVFSIDRQGLPFHNRKRLAKLIGYVPQVHEPPFPFRTLDVVVMGSIGSAKLFSGPSKADFAEAARILEMLGVARLKETIYTEISGGERQMVLIARALMQKPRFLVMDEPTSSLDFGNQMKVLRQVQLLAKSGIGIVMTSHFPDHAFLCCTKAAIMSKNEPFHVGVVEEIVTEETLRRAYGIDVHIFRANLKGRMIKTCVPLLEKDESALEWVVDDR